MRTAHAGANPADHPDHPIIPIPENIMPAPSRQPQANDSLGLGQLATELGWSVRFIEGLVRAEQLPAIRSDGTLRFRRSEVIGWLERKIHHLDRSRVVEMEKNVESSLVADGTFRRPVANDRVSSRLSENAIALDHPAADKPSVLLALTDLAASTGLVYDRMLLHSALVDREALGTTAIPGGVALCHPRQPLAGCVSAPFFGLLRTLAPVEFGAPDGAPTRLFFLICATEERTHLFALSRIVRMLRDSLQERLLDAGTAHEVRTLVNEAEARTSIPSIPPTQHP